MADAMFIHRLGALRPADEEAREVLAGFKADELVKVTMRKPRNGQFHRLFWALMTKVHENLTDRDCEKYPTTETLVAWFKVATGHADSFAIEGRGTVYIPKSISFAKMDNIEFGKFFDRCCDLIAKNFISGVSSEEWKREIQEMIAA